MFEMDGAKGKKNREIIFSQIFLQAKCMGNQD